MIVIVLVFVCIPLLLLPSALHDIHHLHLHLHLSVTILHSVLLQLTIPDFESAPHFTSLHFTLLRYPSLHLLYCPLISISYTDTAVTHPHPLTYIHTRTHIHIHTHEYTHTHIALPEEIVRSDRAV